MEDAANAWDSASTIQRDVRMPLLKANAAQAEFVINLVHPG